MKEIKLDNGRVIRTPWLRRNEAAAYCGISTSMFDAHAANLSHGGESRTRVYNVKVLDAWMRNEIPDCPFKLPKRQ